MRKLLNISFFINYFSVFSLITLMAFKGIETKRFNNIISQKISENNNDIDLELDTINFKIDIKNFSLFLETKNPNIFYKNVTIPARNIKVYINFFVFY